MGGNEVVRSFFFGFAYYRTNQRFSRIQVARWLVNAAPIRRVFFDHEEQSVVFDDGGYGNCWFPDIWHFFLEMVCGENQWFCTA
jgi:hypothetical protein